MVSTRLRRSIKKKNWSKLFDELDENDDGVLNYQEFWKYKEIRTSMQLSEALNLFDEADLNNDREINKDEFITHMNLTTHTNNNNWIALFNELDTNGDGVLTYQEFWEKDAIHNSEDLMEALNEFVDADENNDQHITIDEFVAFMEKRSRKKLEDESLTSSQSEIQINDAKDFKGFNGRLGSDSGGKTNVTNVHDSMSPPPAVPWTQHSYPAQGSSPGMGPGMGPGNDGTCPRCQAGMGPGMGFGMGPGIGLGMGLGMGPGMGMEPSVFGEDLTDQAAPMDQETMNQAMIAAMNARFRRFVGISANLTAQWKNQNILGQFEYFKEDDHGCPIYKRKGLTSRKQEVYLYRIHGNNKWRIGPVFHGSGAVNCWLYIVSDVTDPHEIEQDQAKTRNVWHEHKKGEWVPTKTFKLKFEE